MLEIWIYKHITYNMFMNIYVENIELKSILTTTSINPTEIIENWRGFKVLKYAITVYGISKIITMAS